MTRLRLYLAAAALAAAFAAGWQINGWRIDALRADDAEQAAERLQAELDARRAVEAEVIRLRRDYQTAQEALDAIPDTGACGLDADRVRILDTIR